MKTRIRVEKTGVSRPSLRYYAEYKKYWFQRKWTQISYEYAEAHAQHSIDQFLRDEDFNGKIIKYPPKQ